MDEKQWLKMRQEAGELVEQRMIAYLLQYGPVNDLTVRNIKTIASFAREISFDEFSKIATS